MAFSLVSIHSSQSCGRVCPNVVMAAGEITDQTPDRFLGFLRDNLANGEIRPLVFLNSPGGKVVASTELGEIFRRLGLVTVVASIASEETDQLNHLLGGRCLSACVYALMGGKKRVIPPQSVVGLHRMSMYEQTESNFGFGGALRRTFDDGETARILRRYSLKMGVDPALVDRAERLLPDQIHILSRAEIGKWRLGAPKL